MPNKHKLGIGLILVLAIAVVLQAQDLVSKLRHPPSRSRSADPVRLLWAEPRITIDVSTGQPGRRVTTFVSNRDSWEVSFLVEGDLAEYVEVQPTSINRPGVRTENTLTLVATPPSGTTPGIYSARLVPSINNHLVDLPLELMIRVWNRFEDTEHNYRFSYPPGWSLTFSTEESFVAGATIKSVDGSSLISLFPEGGYGYGFDLDTTHHSIDMMIDDHHAVRDNFINMDGELVVSQIYFVPPGIPDLPVFQIDYRPGEDSFEEERVLKGVLESLDVW